RGRPVRSHVAFLEALGRIVDREIEMAVDLDRAVGGDGPVEAGLLQVVVGLRRGLVALQLVDFLLQRIDLAPQCLLRLRLRDPAVQRAERGGHSGKKCCTGNAHAGPSSSKVRPAKARARRHLMKRESSWDALLPVRYGD